MNGNMNRNRGMFAFGVITCLVALGAVPGCAVDEGAPDVGGNETVASPLASSQGVEPQVFKDWRKGMTTVAFPKSHGCFHARHPAKTWEEVPCGNAPTVPPIRARGRAQPAVVGNGTDYMAVSTSLSEAEGSFASVANLTSIKDTTWGAGYYGLQLNTNFFQPVSLCGNRVGCMGWEQFVLQNTPSGGILSYWSILINYGSTCPSSSWIANGGDCYLPNSPVNVPNEPITNLAAFSMAGFANYIGVTNEDAAIFSDGSGQMYASLAPSLGLTGHWTNAEFNLFGYGGGSQANVSTGTTIAVQIDLTSVNGTPVTPSWTSGGTTGESIGNLTLVKSSACAIGGTSSLVFTESTSSTAKPLLCSLDPSEDNYYQEKACSLESSGDSGAVGVLSNGNIYLGQGFQPASGQYGVASWTNLGHGASAPKSHPAVAYVEGSSGSNYVVLYTGADHKIYETHQVSDGIGTFSPWSAQTYAIPSGWSANSAVAAVNAIYGNFGMMIAVLDSAHKVHALLSDGQTALSGWVTPPSKVLLGAPALYSDPNNNYYLVGVDSTTKLASQILFSPSTMNFSGSWTAEPGTTKFATGVTASFSAFPNSYVSGTQDYLVTLAGGGPSKASPWVDAVDWTTASSAPHALPGTFDSAPSAGNSTGCNEASCWYEPLLVIHAQDMSCYWRDVADVTGDWREIGHP